MPHVLRCVIWKTVLLYPRLKKQGLDELLMKIESVLESEMSLTTIHVPFDRGDIVSYIHERGVIVEESHTDTGTHITVRIPDFLLEVLDEFLVKG